MQPCQQTVDFYRTVCEVELEGKSWNNNLLKPTHSIFAHSWIMHGWISCSCRNQRFLISDKSEWILQNGPSPSLLAHAAHSCWWGSKWKAAEQTEGRKLLHAVMFAPEVKLRCTNPAPAIAHHFTSRLWLWSGACMCVCVSVTHSEARQGNIKRDRWQHFDPWAARLTSAAAHPVYEDTAYIYITGSLGMLNHQWPL